jgi:glutamate--cysteine ligase
MQPETLPSSRVLSALQDFDNSFLQFGRSQSLKTQALLLAMPWTSAQQASLLDMSAQSVADQKKIEAADTMSFENYRQQYLSAARLDKQVRALAAVD